MLCDAANVREGLMNVLSAGVSRVLRPTLPAAGALTVALLVDLAPGEITRPHELNIRVVNPSGKKIAELMAGFQLGRNYELEPGEHGLVPVPVPFQIELTEYGEHHVRIEIDKDAATAHLRFWVKTPPNPLEGTTSPN